MIDFQMVHPTTFKNNPLIKHLKNDPYWTVSDDMKRPINAKILLETGQIYNAKFDGESPLVTLNQLDLDENLQAVNRAYRLRAKENRVIVIDVEPEASDELKQKALLFPAHYTELSRNGGIHLLIHVPEDCINDENRYMFDDLSVFKEPVPQTTDKSKQRPAHYEVIFNDHFITFTKKMDVEKECIDFNTDLVAKQQLVDFLHMIVQLDGKRRVERELTKQFRIENIEKSISPEKRESIEQFLELKALDVARKQADEKDVSNFSNDYSRYEMSVASGIAYHAIRTHNLAKETVSFGDLAKSLTEQDIVLSIYLLVKRIVPYREKHDELRNELPWLLFTSRGAYEYSKSKSKNKAKR